MENEREKEEAREKPVSRRKARKKLLEMCFEADFREIEDAESFLAERLSIPPDNDPTDPDNIVEGEFTEENERFLRRVFHLVLDNANTLDAVIARYPWEWSYDRIGRPERSILRIALAELLYTDTPLKIVINEALDLAKAYGEHDANKFINGILGSIVSDMETIRREYNI